MLPWGYEAFCNCDTSVEAMKMLSEAEPQPVQKQINIVLRSNEPLQPDYNFMWWQ